MPKTEIAGISATSLIGREAELATIFRLFKQAELGRGSVALVVGPGGIGKSRLISEVSTRLRSMGALVIRNQANTFDSGVPYSLLSGLVDDLSGDINGETRETVQQIRSIIGASPSNASGRRNGVVSFADQLIRKLTENTPLVIVAEDLHLADDDSLALLTRLARTIGRTRTILLGSARTHGAYVSTRIDGLVTFLQGADQGFIFDLAALDASETRSVVSEILGEVPDDELTNFVYSNARGNPFFTSEVVRNLVRSGRIRKSHARAHLIEGRLLLPSHTSLIHRFFEVGSVDTKVARVLSTFGRIELSQLEAIESVSGLTEEVIRESFDRLVAAGLLHKEGRNRFAFTHSLLRDALYEDIGPAEQRRLHRLIIEFLIEQKENGRDVDDIELATHVAASAERGDEQAIEILLGAAHRVAKVAPLAAASWFEKASRLVRSDPALLSVLTAERAHALFRASRPAEAAAVAREALAHLQPGRLRDRTICDVVNSLYISGDLSEVIDFIECQGNICDLPLSVQAQYEHFLVQLGSPEVRRSDHFREVEPSTGTQETVTLAHDMFHASLTDRFDLIGLGIERIENLRPVASESVQLAMDSFLAMVFLTYEDVAAAKTVIDRAGSTEAPRSNLSLSALLETSACTLQFILGEWDQVLSYSDDLLWQMESQGIHIMEAFLRSSPCLIYLERGDLRMARELSSQLRTPAHGMKATVEAAVARVERVSGNPQLGIDRLEKLRESRRQIGMTIQNHLILEELANCHLAVGSREVAERLADELRSDWTDSPFSYVSCRASLSYGSIQGNVDHLQRSVEIAESSSFKFEAGKGRLFLAELGVDASSNFERSVAVFEELGAVRWHQQALAGLRRLGVSTPRKLKATKDGLTGGEVAIAKLVAQGLTNREIASTLHYSVKTIEVYLTRIYSKTNCVSRLDLARAVDRGALDVG